MPSDLFSTTETFVSSSSSTTGRRRFLQTAGIVTGTALATGGVLPTATPRVHAAEGGPLKVAIIGCGGRGRGALIQALNTPGPLKLWAVGDAFTEHANSAVQSATKAHPDKVDVGDRIFTGLDAFKKVMDSLDPGSAVILATPPVFRPPHLEYAVSKGLHVFMEKSFAVDTPGVKRVLAANKIAKEKNLKISCGLNQRNFIRNEETIKAIQDGMIGDVVIAWVYRTVASMGLRTPKNMTPLEYQLKNFNGFTWCSGSFMLDWMIHNIDVAGWAFGKWPVAVQGQGGRQVRTAIDDMYDHCAYEYTLDDGRQMMVQLRQMPKTWLQFRTVVHGTKGAAVLGEGITDPVIYKGYNQSKEHVLWKPESPWNDSYQEEHNRFFRAIREDLKWNEAERGLKPCFAGIMGRMAVESGQRITYETAWESEYSLCPNVDTLTLDDDSPTMPNEDGRYALAVPGETKAY